MHRSCTVRVILEYCASDLPSIVCARVGLPFVYLWHAFGALLGPLVYVWLPPCTFITGVPDLPLMCCRNACDLPLVCL